MATKFKITINLMDENYPKYVLEKEIIWVKHHLKAIRISKQQNKNFYFPDAEEVMKKRIKDLKTALKKL